MIDAKTASLITIDSCNKREAEKYKNSLVFLEEKLNLNIKERAANGYFTLFVPLKDNEIKKINIDFIIIELKKLGYTANYDKHYKVLEIEW